jgi:activating signal cointegrator complex subunit 1
MQSPAKSSVLYAPPADKDGILYSFCEKVRRAFLDAEIMAEEGRPLLLHATVLNTIYVKGGRASRGGGSGRRGRHGAGSSRLVIDATEILDRYEDFVWMEDLVVEKIAICRMGAKKVEDGDEGDEAYEVEAEIEV